jgi:integrase
MERGRCSTPSASDCSPAKSMRVCRVRHRTGLVEGRRNRSQQLPREALQEDFVFLRMDRSAYYKHLYTILKLAGMPCDRRCSFHKTRRTHATHLYIAGGDATQSPGHESDAMTRGYYLDTSQIRTQHPADLLVVGWVRRWWRKLKSAI